MATTPPERQCGETPRGSHGGHRYMLGSDVYQCPGGDVHLPSPGPTLTAKVLGMAYSMIDLIESPCQQWGLQEPHDAHDFISADGPAQCPGWGEPSEGHTEPAPPPTLAEQVRDLERTIERVREAVGTDTVLLSCEQHEARIGELTTTLGEVLARFVHDTHPGRRCKQTDHVNVETIARWHAALNGEA